MKKYLKISFLALFVFGIFIISPSFVDAQSVTIDIKANGSNGPVSLSAGQTLNLTWSSPGTPINSNNTATDKVGGCSLNGGGVEVSDSSSIPIIYSSTDPTFHPQYPKTTTTYTFTCYLVGAAPNYPLTSTTVSDSVTVNPPPAPAINSFTVSPTTIDLNATAATYQDVVFTWSASNVTRVEYTLLNGNKRVLGECNFPGIAYDRGTTGSFTLPYWQRPITASTVTYTLTCNSASSVDSASRTVSVTYTKSTTAIPPVTTQVPCAPGDIYDYRDGSLCPGATAPITPPVTTTPPITIVPTTQVICAPGDIYNYTNGQLCPGATAPTTPITTTPTTTTSGTGLLPTSTPTYQQPANFSSITVSKPSKQGVVLTASPTSITLGQPSQLAWNSSGVSSCSSTDFYVPRSASLSGTVLLYPLKTTTYWITCYTSTGTTRAWATIIVNGVASNTSPLSGSESGGTAVTTTTPTSTTPTNTNTSSGPFVDIKVNGSDGPTTLAAGQSVMLTWTSANVGGCTLSSPQTPALTSGVNPTSTGTFYPIGHPFFPTVTSTYKIDCFAINSNLSLSTTPVSDSVTLNVGTAVSTPIPSPTSGTCTTFAIGCFVQVTGCSGCTGSSNIALNVRPQPSLSSLSWTTSTGANANYYVSSGVIGEIVGGPVVADGHTWWQIDYAGNSIPVGWSSQSYLAWIPTPKP